MNYAQIFDCDIANGPGMRVSLFVSGCTHHCEGCFNAQTWDFAYGKKYTSEITQALIQMMDRPYIKGITILGGEPRKSERRIGSFESNPERIQRQQKYLDLFWVCI